MTRAPADHDFHRRMVRLWLYAVAAMVFATLIIGGATRLTESGLSITEWKPVTGVLPPYSHEAWQEEFAKYQAIPQYREINRGMSLDEFKTIYWWEWGHRVSARLTGAIFLIPFLFFLWRGWIERSLRTRLWTIFGAGAALGAVGWWMVSSGLVGRTSVSQYRLAFHMTLACAIYAALLWTAQGLRPRGEGVASDTPRRIRITAVALMLLTLAQIYLGALVAGLRAGLIYNTWPLIDDTLIPAAERLLVIKPAWRNFFENTLTVQFDHRMLAYALFALAILHLIDVARTFRRGPILAGAAAVVTILTLQMAIGIVTLLEAAPLPLALAHQAVAVVVLTFAAVHAARIAGQAVAAGAGQGLAVTGAARPLPRG